MLILKNNIYFNHFKVNDWRAYLQPILRATESRNDFSISEYQQRIIAKIGKIGNSKTFEEIVEKPDCCRFFSSFLGLVSEN